MNLVTLNSPTVEDLSCSLVVLGELNHAIRDGALNSKFSILIDSWTRYGTDWTFTDDKVGETNGLLLSKVEIVTLPNFAHIVIYYV